MQTMKAAVVVEPGKLDVLEVPVPAPGPYQALVAIEACSFCSSTDLKIVHNELPFVSDYPCILGHESVGRVVQCGEMVRHLAEGDRVLRPVAAYPGEKLGEYFSGWGGFAEYGLVTDWRAAVADGRIAEAQVGLWPRLQQTIPDDMDAADATMLITLKETLSSLQDMGMRPGASVLVVGDGAVGAGFARWAKMMGGHPVAVAGHHDDRLERIAALGADAVINTSATSLQKGVEGCEALKGARFDFIIDAVGSGEICAEAVGLLAGGGTIAVYGVSAKMDAAVNLLALPVGARILRASTAEDRVHQQAIDAWRLGLLPLRDFYSHVLPLDGAVEGLRLLEEREAFKVVLTTAGKD